MSDRAEPGTADGCNEATGAARDSNACAMDESEAGVRAAYKEDARYRPDGAVIEFTDTEWLVFCICIMLDTLAAAAFIGTLIYYVLICLLCRRGRWARIGDRLADRKWGRGNWEYSDE